MPANKSTIPSSKVSQQNNGQILSEPPLISQRPSLISSQGAIVHSKLRQKIRKYCHANSQEPSIYIPPNCPSKTSCNIGANTYHRTQCPSCRLSKLMEHHTLASSCRFVILPYPLISLVKRKSIFFFAGRSRLLTCGTARQKPSLSMTG